MTVCTNHSASVYIWDCLVSALLVQCVLFHYLHVLISVYLSNINGIDLCNCYLLLWSLSHPKTC